MNRHVAIRSTPLAIATRSLVGPDESVEQFEENNCYSINNGSVEDHFTARVSHKCLIHKDDNVKVQYFT